MMLPLYRALTSAGRPLIRLYLAYRQTKGKEDPERFSERLGQPGRARPEGKLIWAHAASIGEALSLLPLIEKFAREQDKLNIMITTGTVTSAKLMTERLPKNTFHQFVPVDCLAYVRPFLNHWQPDLVLWAESEFWPNMIHECHDRAIPMALVNGRISSRSFDRWQRQAKFIRRLLSPFKLCLGQTDLDAERLRVLGAANTQCLGNLKFSAPPLPVDEAEMAKLESMIGKRPCWLAASTHPGEEEVIAEAHQALRTTSPGTLTIVVPRHPERGNTIKEIFEAAGLKTSQRSQSQAPSPETDVYIADTLGELGLFYRLCDIVFMGKSLSDENGHGGGQNPLEPARLQCAIVQGPHTINFADITDNLRKAGAFRKVTDAGTLHQTVGELLNDPAACKRLALAAAQIAQSQDGALDRIYDSITPLLLAGTPQKDHHANT